MADLKEQTAVQSVGGGRYRADVSTDWKAWGPIDGYLAAIALRAAGEHTRMARPASLSCHYLGEATFGPVDIEVVTLCATHRAESIQVRLVQEGFTILQALMWTTETGMTGPDVNWTIAPEGPHPSELSQLILDEDAKELFGDAPFWNNLEIRPVRLNDVHLITKQEVRAFRGEDDRFVPKFEPRNRAWERFSPTAMFDDPWTDACRSLLLIDLTGYPTVAKPFVPLAFIATTLETNITFHTAAPEDEWLLIEANAPAAHDGLLGCRASVWGLDGRLVATGSSHMLYRDLADLDPATPDRLARESPVPA